MELQMCRFNNEKKKYCKKINGPFSDVRFICGLNKSINYLKVAY